MQSNWSQLEEPDNELFEDQQLIESVTAETKKRDEEFYNENSEGLEYPNSYSRQGFSPYGEIPAHGKGGPWRENCLQFLRDELVEASPYSKIIEGYKEEFRGLVKAFCNGTGNNDIATTIARFCYDMG